MPFVDRTRGVLRSAWATAAGLWAGFIVLVAITGQRFDAGYLTFGWQLVPAEILRSDPFGSVWNLHIQPPLWNLTIGIILRWSPLPDVISLQLLQLLIGMALVAAIAATASRFVPRWLAVGAALVAGLHPDTVGNAFTPTYELVTAALLAGFVWVVVCQRHRRHWLVAAALLASAVGLVRSMYHPAVIVGGLAAVILFTGKRSEWRRSIATLLIPIVLLGGWMLKNELMFGRATLSSWFGMNLQRAVIPPLPLADLQRLRAAGEVSEIAVIGPFGNYALYETAMPPCTPTHDHPALTNPTRISAVVVPNFNYECFLPVFDQAGSDAIAVIKDSPGTFLRGRLWSARTWFVTSGFAEGSPSPVMRTAGWVYGLLGLEYTGVISTAGWGTPIYASLEAPADFSVTLIVMSLVTLGAGLFVLGHALRRRRWRLDDGPLALVLVAGISAYTFAAGVTFELGEQARFRTMTDPLLISSTLVLGAVLLGRRLRRRATEDLGDHAGLTPNQLEGGGAAEVDTVGS